MVEPQGHALGDIGKGLRPAMALLAGRVYDYHPELHLPLATATELLHAASLIHDDAIDHSQMRRGKPTVNSLWGWQTSVILGDYLFATSADMVSTTGNVRVMRLFARSLMTLSRGEMKEYFSAFNLSQKREHYYQRIGNKTASLFAMPAECGAILGEAPEEAVDILRGYGYNVGLAFQIVDDLLDFVGNEAEMGKPVGSDLLQGTVTLPAILLLERCPEDNPIGRLFQDKGNPRCLKEAVDAICNSDIIDHCYKIAAEFLSRARESLDALPQNASTRSLRELTGFVIERKR